jgi:hypothetical protein
MDIDTGASGTWVWNSDAFLAIGIFALTIVMILVIVFTVWVGSRKIDVPTTHGSRRRSA